MATYFRFIAGSSSIDLNNGAGEAAATDYFVSHYTPGPGPVGSPTVDEQVVITVKGTSAADLRTNLDALNAFIERVDLWRRQGDTVDRVYVHFAPDGVAAGLIRRAQLYKVDVSYEQNWVDEDWHNGYMVEVTMTMTRDNFGELAAETTMLLTNTNGTDVTDGSLKVYNCNDGSGSPPSDRCQYIHINGEDILGDLPAGCKITVTVGSGDMTTLYYGAGSGYATANAPIIEAEAIAGLTPEADANCSGGNFAAFTANTQVAVTFSGLDSKGSWFIPIIRCKFGTESTSITLQNGYWGQPRTSRPTHGTASWEFHALPPVKFPETYYPGVAYSGMRILYLTFGADTDVDYIMLMPVDGGWRIADLIYESPVPNVFVDDTMHDYTYYYYSSALETARSGPGIFLEPNKDNRIWFACSYGPVTEANRTDVAAYKTIAITYRPRYRSL